MGMGEVVLIFLIVLLLFGARRLPEIGRALGAEIRTDLGSPRTPSIPRRQPSFDVSALVERARDEARAYEQRSVGAAALFLALTASPDPTVALALARLGLDAEAMRWRIKESLTLGDVPGQGDLLPLSRAATRVLEDAVVEARVVGDVRVRPAHVFLALLGQPAVAYVLASFGVTAREARRETMLLLVSA